MHAALLLYLAACTLYFCKSLQRPQQRPWLWIHGTYACDIMDIMPCDSTRISTLYATGHPRQPRSGRRRAQSLPCRAQTDPANPIFLALQGGPARGIWISSSRHPPRLLVPFSLEFIITFAAQVGSNLSLAAFACKRSEIPCTMYAQLLGNEWLLFYSLVRQHLVCKDIFSLLGLP